MLPLQRALPPQGLLCKQLFRQYNTHMMCPMTYKVISERSDALITQNNDLIVQLRRRLHVTTVNRDLEAGLKYLGAGIAGTGVIGSGIGLGIIFGNLLTAVARNPSVSNKAFTNAVMGAAFCESLGLFAMAISFTIMAS